VWPGKVLVVALIGIGLQAAVARGFAIWMVEVINGAFSDPMYIIDAALQESASTNSGIDKGKRSILAALS
jgi:hypothetical protein